MQEHALDMLDRLDAVDRIIWKKSNIQSRMFLSFYFEVPKNQGPLCFWFNSDTELQIFPTTREMELPNTGDPDSKMKKPQTHILDSAWYSSFGWLINRGIIQWYKA